MDGKVLADRPGVVACDLPGYESHWVQFRTNGYPYRLRREWAAADSDATLEIVLRYVVAWDVPAADGTPLPLPDQPRGVACLDELEDALLSWLIRSFQRHWLITLTSPAKNSSAPSPGT